LTILFVLNYGKKNEDNFSFIDDIVEQKVAQYMKKINNRDDNIKEKCYDDVKLVCYKPIDNIASDFRLKINIQRYGYLSKLKEEYIQNIPHQVLYDVKEKTVGGTYEGSMETVDGTIIVAKQKREIGDQQQQRGSCMELQSIACTNIPEIPFTSWNCISTDERPDPNIWNCFIINFMEPFNIDLIKIMDPENDPFCGIFNNEFEIITSKKYLLQKIIADPIEI